MRGIEAGVGAGKNDKQGDDTGAGAGGMRRHRSGSGGGKNEKQGDGNEARFKNRQQP